MRFVRLILIILILGTPLGAYVPRRTMTLGGLAFQKWADASFPVTWRLNSVRGWNVTGARDLGEVFRQAFQTWSAVSTARVSFAEGASTNATDAAQDGINLVSVTPAVYNLDVPSTTILYTVTNPTASQFPGQIVEADVLFNPQTLLSTDVSVPQDRYDLQSLAVHEIGHLMGLDHSGLASAAMFPTSVQGSSLLRTLDLDDVLGVSNLYPTDDFFAGRGTVHGLVRAPSGAPAFGAHVVLVDGSGKPVASTLTDPDGSYFVRGLEPGNYSAYAEPLDQPLTAAAVPALGQAFPNQTPSTAFTTRFAATVGTASTLTLTKTGGDNQSGSAGQSLPQPLEVTVRDGGGNPIAGAVVRFAAASGGGVVVPIQATTDAQGKTRATAYLGKGATQTFIASAASSTVSFTASGQITISLITFVDPATNSLMKELIVNEGQSIATPARVLDSTGAARTDIALTYTSSNPEVAAVDAAGVIRGVKAGFSTLTVSGAGVVSAATITVVQITAAAGSTEISGVVQDLAQRLYLAANQNHTILLAQSLAQAPQVYAGVHQTPGFVNAGRAQSLFRNPAFLAFNQADGSLYVSDSANNVIRKVLPGSGGMVETLAGTGAAGSQNGPMETATFNNPQGIALDNVGNLWVVDSGNHAIRRIDLSARTVETIAGQAGSPGSSDGAGAQARFTGPVGIALETELVVQELGRFFLGGAPPAARMIVADTGNGLLRRVTASGQVETLTAAGASAAALTESKGSDPVFAAALPLLFNAPTGIGMDAFGNVYLTEPDSGRVKVLLRNGDVVAAAPAGAFIRPKGLAVSRTGKVVVASGNNTAQEIVYGSPEILSVDPPSASNKGGSQVTVRGKNFAPGTGIVVAGTVIFNVELRDTETAVFTVPALPSGRTTLTVFNRAGLAQTAFFAAPTPLSELPAGYITTIAGGSTFAGDGSRASAAMLDTPYRLAIDKFGNLYIADRNNFRIRRVDVRTGIITTVAGNGRDGSPTSNVLATTSPLLSPEAVAVDPKGNVYFSSSNQGQVNRVDSITGVLTSFVPSCCGGLEDMAVDSDGNLFLADFGNNRVLKVAAGSTVATVFAGGGSSSVVGDGGPATQAYVREPQGLAVDRAGNVYISERLGRRVRKVDRQGTITTVAGMGNCCFSGDGGPATAAGLQSPSGLAVDSEGNLYIGDHSVTTGAGSVTTHRIRKVDAVTGIIRTLTTFPTEFNPSLSGPGYDFPKSMVVDGAGELSVSFSFGHQILRVDTNTGAMTAVAGIGAPFTGDGLLASESALLRPYGLAFDNAGSLFITDRDMHRVRRIDGITQKITTVAGNGKYGFPVDHQQATQSSFGQPDWAAADGFGNPYVVLASDTVGSGFDRKDKIWRVDAQTGIASPFLIPFQTSLASSPAGDIYIGSLTDGLIRKYDPATGVISVVASGLAPRSLAFDAAGNLFVADGNYLVRKIEASTGIVTIAAGNGTSSNTIDNVPATQSSILFPSNATNRLAVDANGNLYILETFRIRRVDRQTGLISTLVSSAVFGSVRDNVPAGTGGLDSNVAAIAVDGDGNVFVADTSNKRVRAIRRPDAPAGGTVPAPVTPTLTSVAPNSISVGSSIVVTLTGTGFVAGKTAVTASSSEIAAGNVVVNSPTSLTASLTVAGTAAPGPRTLTVTTPGGASAAGTLNVTAPSQPLCAAVGINTTVNGSLSAGDLPSRLHHRYADCFTFSGNTGDRIFITMNSTEFDAYLFLLDATGQVVASDDQGGGSNNARIPATGSLVLASTGSYTVEAAAFGPPTVGAYAMTVAFVPTVASIDPLSAVIGSTPTVTLTGSNFAAGSTSVGVAVSGAGVTVSNVGPSSLTSLTAKFTIALTAALGPRDVTVVTAGGTSAPVTFTVNGPPCTPIAFGQTINGSLTTSDYPSRAGVLYADCYTFSGNAGDPVVIRMDATAFTSHLYLRDAAGQVVASEDRRIPFSGSFVLPSAGTFTIEATSRFSGQTGEYTLTLTSSP